MVELGRRAAADEAAAAQGAPLQLAHTDWLFHHFAVVGPAVALAAFQDAAAGAGTIPWVIDFDQAEEDWFHRLAAARALSLAGARILARQLREAAERRHGVAMARVGCSRACPLDLNALLPVPAAVLTLGPGHADALAWLWQYWGTTDALRHVTLEDAGTQEGGEPRLQFGFWSADWSPWRAIETIRGCWPGLRFELQAHYHAA